jgi:hypothetical protein
MIDYCLQNKDEAEFNQLMLDTGLCVEVTEGEETTIAPASYEVLIDRIGPITITDYTVDPPVETVYPNTTRICGCYSRRLRIRLRRWPLTPSILPSHIIALGHDRQSA